MAEKKGIGTDIVGQLVSKGINFVLGGIASLFSGKARKKIQNLQDQANAMAAVDYRQSQTIKLLLIGTVVLIIVAFFFLIRRRRK